MIRAGAMRHSITIQQQSTAQDDAGQPLNTWTTFATRRASVDRTPGSEVYAADQRNGRVPTVFRLRWLEGVTPAMRVVGLCPCHLNKVFNILSAIDQGGIGEEMLISAEELVGVAP